MYIFTWASLLLLFLEKKNLSIGVCVCVSERVRHGFLLSGECFAQGAFREAWRKWSETNREKRNDRKKPSNNQTKFEMQMMRNGNAEHDKKVRMEQC